MDGKDLTVIQKPHRGTLTNWVINNLTDRPTVEGNVTGHPHFFDGEWIRTSYIVDMKDGVLETRNSRYNLDEKHELVVVCGVDPGGGVG